MSSFLAKLFILLVAAFVSGISLAGLSKNREQVRNDSFQRAEMRFLPSGQDLQLISFGYKSALSNFLWFNTVSYFGKHFRKDQQYTWLAHMCDLVTTLNPRAKHVYEFGALMLAWEVSDIEGAVKLLSKACKNFPSDWKFLYLRGFIKQYFLNRYEEARQDYMAASMLPGCPPIVARLAAKNFSLTGNLESAIEFLSAAIQASSEPTMKAALQEKLNEVRLELNLKELNNVR